MEKRASFGVIFLAMITATSSSAFAADDSDCTARFAAARETYFDSLDYMLPGVAVASPSVEKELVDLLACDGQLADADRGLPKIYTALFMKNSVQGAVGGWISYETLTQNRRYASESSLRAEVAARLDFVLNLFKEADQERPSDRRIEGWLAGAVAYTDFEKYGKISPEHFDQLMIAVDHYPEFTLNTAYLALFGWTLTEQQQLALQERTRQMTALSSPCSPFRAQVDPVCSNMVDAPFNKQTAMIQFGDAFLARAEKLGPIDPVERTLASGMYTMNLFPGDIATTKAWQNFDVLKGRILRAANPFSGINSQSFWPSTDARRPYQCASCHAGGRPKP